MKTMTRSFVVAFLTLFLGAISAVTMAVALAATALIVPGTGTPNPDVVPNYVANAVNGYIKPTTPSCQITCTPVGVSYPAQIWPVPLPGWGGLTGAKFNVSVSSGVTSLNSKLVDNLTASPRGDIVIFGYSQGATVASLEKLNLANVVNKDQFSFVLIANPQRPNGGLVERLAFLGTVPILDATFGRPTPTATGIKTTDIAFQYDGVTDFPQYPINLLADLNAIAGFQYIHGTYLAPNGYHPSTLPGGYAPAELKAAINDPTNRTTYGDTTYVTVPAKTLPLLMPLIDLGKATGTSRLVTPAVDLVSPALRVLIETGYNRNINPGVPTPFHLVPPIKPIKLMADLVAASKQGVQAAIADLHGQPATPSTAPTHTTITSPNSTTAPDASKTAAPALSAATVSPVARATVSAPSAQGPTDRISTSPQTSADNTDSQAIASATPPPSTAPQNPGTKATNSNTSPLTAAPDDAAMADGVQQAGGSNTTALSDPATTPNTSKTSAPKRSTTTPSAPRSPTSRVSAGTLSAQDPTSQTSTSRSATERSSPNKTPPNQTSTGKTAGRADTPAARTATAPQNPDTTTSKSNPSESSAATSAKASGATRSASQHTATADGSPSKPSAKTNGSGGSASQHTTKTSAKKKSPTTKP